MLKIAPAAVGLMTPAGLAAAFREHDSFEEDRQTAADRRTSIVIRILAAAHGEPEFDEKRLFPRLWDDEYLGLEVDNEKVQGQVLSWVAAYRGTVEA